MKRLGLALILSLFASLAHAQCNGIFTNNTVCGNATGSSNLPRPTAPSAFLGAAGGSNGQIQYNNAGALGGFTAGGDLTFSVPNFTISNNAVTTAKILNDAVTTDKILNSNVTGAKIATGAAVKASGTGQASDVAVLTDTAINQIQSAGYGPKQIPGLVPTTATVTISNGTPAVVTWTGHGLSLGDTVFFCNSGGALPTGLTACVPLASAPECNPCSANTYSSNPTLYYVIPTGTDTFNVATSLANARAGTKVNTSSAGSGTHTAFANAMACGGCVGELIYGTVTANAPVAITTGAPTTWKTLSLSAGVWQIGGNFGVIGTGGTTDFSTWHSNLNYGLGNLLSTSPLDAITAAHISTNSPSGIVLPYTTDNIFLTGATTLNAVGQAAWTGGGTAGAYGRIWARRIK